MSSPRPHNNPQQPEFTTDAMVAALSAQAEAIWPLERSLFRRYRAHTILDAGCGTGEITRRLAGLYPGAEILGIDLEEAQLVRARERSPARIRYEVADAYDLPLADGSADLVVCRHVLQAVADPKRVLAELARVCGGHLHLLCEDYGMIHFAPTRLDNARFWREGVIAWGERIGVDLAVGRRAVPILTELGLEDVRIDYLPVDTLRCRETMQRIWAHWREAYEPPLAEGSPLDPDEVKAHWDEMQAVLADPNGYAVWIVPVASARVPRS